MVSEAEQEQQAISELRKAVRQREQRCVEALLKLYAFRPQDAAASDLPLLDGRWGDDLFNPETLKQLGVASVAVSRPAGAGAGVDLLVGGLTLGAGVGRARLPAAPANRAQLWQPLAGQDQRPARADRR